MNLHGVIHNKKLTNLYVDDQEIQQEQLLQTTYKNKPSITNILLPSSPHKHCLNQRKSVRIIRNPLTQHGNPIYFEVLVTRLNHLVW